MSLVRWWLTGALGLLSWQARADVLQGLVLSSACVRLPTLASMACIRTVALLVRLLTAHHGVAQHATPPWSELGCHRCGGRLRWVLQDQKAGTSLPLIASVCEGLVKHVLSEQ